jgi:hypothetical protein
MTHRDWAFLLRFNSYSENKKMRNLTAISVLLASLGSVAQATGQQTKNHIQTVFIILMENHNWTGGKGGTSIKGNRSAPYINNTLLPMASHAEQYFNPPGIHPSLPNYLWLEAASEVSQNRPMKVT